MAVYGVVKNGGEVEAEVVVEVQIGVDILRGVKVKAGVEAPKKVLAMEEVVHLVEWTEEREGRIKVLDIKVCFVVFFVFVVTCTD